MFDLNIFDEDHIEEPEEPEEPPPPVFSEEELETARKEAYQQGKNDAGREARESREQFIASQLEVIASTLPRIFQEEDLREKRYEEEALLLAHGMLRKCFPAFTERYGTGEVMEVVSKVLGSMEGRTSIKIEIASDTAEELGKHLETAFSSGGENRIELVPVKDMGHGSCRITWGDGGAVRNAQELACRIEEGLSKLLAARGVKLGYSDSDNSDTVNTGDDKIPENSKTINHEGGGEDK